MGDPSTSAVLSLCLEPPREACCSLRDAAVDVKLNGEGRVERVPEQHPSVATTLRDNGIILFLIKFAFIVVDFLTLSFFPYLLAFSLKKSFPSWGCNFRSCQSMC